MHFHSNILIITTLALCACHYTETNSGRNKTITSILPSQNTAGAKAEEPTMTASEPDSAVFHLDDLGERQAQKKGRYLSFFLVKAMNAGLYVLPHGVVDGQKPHPEDEIYHVISGRAQFRVGDKDHAVSAGSIIYVKRGIEHRFHTIEAELRVLVVFAGLPDDR